MKNRKDKSTLQINKQLNTLWLSTNKQKINEGSPKKGIFLLNFYNWSCNIHCDRNASSAPPGRYLISKKIISIHSVLSEGRKKKVFVLDVTLWRAKATDWGEEEKRESRIEFHSSQLIHGTNLRARELPSTVSSADGSINPSRDSIVDVGKLEQGFKRYMWVLVHQYSAYKTIVYNKFMLR